MFIGGFVFCSRQIFLLLGSPVDTTTLSISCSGFLGLLRELSQAYRLFQTEPKCFNFVIVFSPRQVPAPTLIIIARSFQSPSCLKFLPSCKATGIKCRYKTDILQKTWFCCCQTCLVAPAVWPPQVWTAWNGKNNPSLFPGVGFDPLGHNSSFRTELTIAMLPGGFCKQRDWLVAFSSSWRRFWGQNPPALNILTKISGRRGKSPPLRW